MSHKVFKKGRFICLLIGLIQCEVGIVVLGGDSSIESDTDTSTLGTRWARRVVMTSQSTYTVSTAFGGVSYEDVPELRGKPHGK